MAKKGDRIEVLRCDDPHVTVSRGMRGTVDFVDALGTTHVSLDLGPKIGLIADEDEFRLLAPEEESASG